MHDRTAVTGHARGLLIKSTGLASNSQIDDG